MIYPKIFTSIERTQIEEHLMTYDCSQSFHNQGNSLKNDDDCRAVVVQN